MAGTTEQRTKPPDRLDVRRPRSAEERLQAILRLLRLADELGNVSEACSIVGYSRSTFYRLRKCFENGGVAALAALKTHRPHLRRRVPAKAEELILRLARDRPEWGRDNVAHALRRRGQAVSAPGVEHVWARHGLETPRKREAARWTEPPVPGVPAPK
jgi:transposase